MSHIIDLEAKRDLSIHRAIPCGRQELINTSREAIKKSYSPIPSKKELLETLSFLEGLGVIRFDDNGNFIPDTDQDSL